MTPEQWAKVTTDLIQYAKDMAHGKAEPIEPLPPLEWWKWPTLETEPSPYDGGYRNAPSDYRRPITL